LPASIGKPKGDSWKLNLEGQKNTQNALHELIWDQEKQKELLPIDFNSIIPTVINLIKDQIMESLQYIISKGRWKLHQF
jgi:hypothetical protein